MNGCKHIFSPVLHEMFTILSAPAAFLFLSLATHLFLLLFLCETLSEARLNRGLPFLTYLRSPIYAHPLIPFSNSALNVSLAVVCGRS